MKKYFFMAACATALFATSCSDNEVPEIETPNDQKEMISLSVGMGEQVVKAPTRAATYGGFTAPTRILMRLQSDNNEAANDKHRYTKTLARADAGSNYSGVSQDGAYLRYWDDAFGRKAYLSVFAVAIPDKDDANLLKETSLKGELTWSETFTAGDNEITWEVNSHLSTNKLQNSDVLKNQDLVYSNNIQKGSPEGGRYVYDFEASPAGYKPTEAELAAGTASFTPGRMCFKYKDEHDETSLGRFDKGHLVFNHALSRLTLTIKSGDGFDAQNKFKLYTDGDNGVQALNMPVEGKLDVQVGSWSVTQNGIITTQPTVVRPDGSNTYASYTTSMQMLPGYVFSASSDANVLQFRIDDNEYYITQKMIHEALKLGANELTGDDPYTMEQGKNYTLTVTVNKTKVDNITAKVAEWEDVAGKEQTLHNSYVTLNLKATDGTACDHFTLYRMKVDAGGIHTSETTPSANDYENKEWMGDYDESIVPTSEDNVNWKTTWYFEDNRTFYHFRTVNNDTIVHETGTGTDDYFTITAGPVATNDPHWGAPLESAATNTYKTDGSDSKTAGYGANIYKAIGSTTGTIAIQEFHMLSEINVILKTPNNEGGVELTDGVNNTVVTLYQYAKDAKVKMGNGWVFEQTNVNTESVMTQPDPFELEDEAGTKKTKKAYTFRVVPQKLSRGDAKTDKVAIKIQTPDENLYYCIEDLSTIKPNDSEDAITYWLPNHKYTYTFVISKKGIDNITCRVANWETVNAADKDINLED